jgi:hypothetical protein
MSIEFRSMKHLNLLTLCLILASCLFCSSCGISRVSTTTKGAVERALLAESIVKSVESLDFKIVGGKDSALVKKTFYISNVTTPQPTEAPLLDFQFSYLKGLIINDLLSRGLNLAKSIKKADLIVIPTVHFANLDDNEFILGLPSIPIPVPSVGTMSTPELSLFGVYSQFGRSKISLSIVNQSNGELLAQGDSAVSESAYNRWKLLFFFGWRTTTLDSPF